MLSFLSHGDVPHLLHAYGYWAVGGIVAIESIGLPLPGETTLIAAAIVAGTSHELDIRWVIAVAAIGAILGDNIGFWIGRELGYRLVLRYGRYVRITEPRIKIGQYLFLRWGGAVVFLGRFVAVLRALAAFLAGANRMGWRRFLVCNATGALLWAVAYGVGAYYLGEGISRLAAPLGIGIGALAVAVLALAAVLVHRHEPELERKAAEALPGPVRPGGT